MSHVHAVARALSSKRKGIARAFEMGVASYRYNRAYDLTRRESLAGAWDLFVFYWKNP